MTAAAERGRLSGAQGGGRPFSAHRGPPGYLGIGIDGPCGGSALAVRGDEAVEAWRVVEPVLAA